MFTVQALETVRNSPEGVIVEVWRKQVRYDVIFGSLLKRRSCDHDKRDLACEVNMLGAKRLS